MFLLVVKPFAVFFAVFFVGEHRVKSVYVFGFKVTVSNESTTCPFIIAVVCFAVEKLRWISVAGGIDLYKLCFVREVYRRSFVTVAFFAVSSSLW